MISNKVLQTFRQRAVSSLSAHLHLQLRPLTHVCIVGTGPGGFYTAKYLLKEKKDIRVDLLDALPTPYGESERERRLGGVGSGEVVGKVVQSAPLRTGVWRNGGSTGACEGGQLWILASFLSLPNLFRRTVLLQRCLWPIHPSRLSALLSPSITTCTSLHFPFPAPPHQQGWSAVVLPLTTQR